MHPLREIDPHRPENGPRLPDPERAKEETEGSESLERTTLQRLYNVAGEAISKMRFDFSIANEVCDLIYYFVNLCTVR